MGDRWREVRTTFIVTLSQFLLYSDSAAGKSQLALQMSLTIQLSRELGGLEGSACILLTSKSLYTNRLLEMVEYHPLLSSDNCGLSNIHTTRTSIIPELLRALKTELPKFCEEKASGPESKAVKLVVIDTLTELFHVDGETRATSLWQRAKDLAEISSCLHSLAHRHNVAVVVLNEVTDAFEPPVGDTNTDDLLYRNQARFFNRADSIPGENMKEAALGLVWANQVNARIMLTRTERMRELEDTEARPSKRRRLDSNAGPSASQSNLTRIRRLTVIFSNVAPPTSLDYIITSQGFSALPDSEEPRMSTQQPTVPPPAPVPQIRHPVQDVTPPEEVIPSSQSQPLLPTFVELPSDDQPPQPLSDGVEIENGPEPEEDEWDSYWKEVDTMEDLYAELDPSIPSSSLPAHPLHY